MAAGSLLEAVADVGSGGFVADTAPIIYRLERRVEPATTAALDPLFDAVESGQLGCIVSAVSMAELLIAPFRHGAAAVSTVDRFLRQPMVGLADVDGQVARAAAQAIAMGRLPRLPDALIAATAKTLSLPLVTNDRRLAQSGVATAFYVRDYV